MPETTLTRDVTLPAAGTWTIDPAHTTIGFVARHLMVSKVRGHFDRFDAEIVVSDAPEESSVAVTIDAASVTTGVEQRDGHLRSPDFFDVANYPTISFRGTGVRGSGSRWQLTGDLTVRAVTRPVTLDVTFEGVARSPFGDERAGFSARTELNREDWGLTWNQVLEGGGLLVGKKVTVEVEVELIRAA